MPLVLAGTCLAGLSLLVQRRRQWLAALSVATLVAAILPVSRLAVAGSDKGSTLSLFDFVEWEPIYHHLTSAGMHPAVGRFLPEGLQSPSARSVVVLALLLLVPLVDNLGRLAPMASVASKRLRQDPAAWFLAGIVLAGWVVYLTLSHPAYSQAYFLRLANPVATIFGVWALAAAVPVTAETGPPVTVTVGPGTRGRRVSAVFVVVTGGTLLGAGVLALGRTVRPALPAASVLSESTQDLVSVVAAFAVPLVVLCAAGIVGLAVWAGVRRKVPALRGWGLALALAAVVLGGPVGSAAIGYARDARAFVQNTPVPQGGTMAGPLDGHRLSAGSGAAIAWLGQHTTGDAVVATNRHCVEGPQRPGCLSFAFWVSGLGGRRTVLEGWAYTGSAKSATASTPFPARLAVNDAAFTDPTQGVIDRLRRGYGASWLVADRSAGPVSPALALFATARFSSGDVTVYQLH
jgi:hypothetical protein